METYDPESAESLIADDFLFLLQNLWQALATNKSNQYVIVFALRDCF